MDCTVIEFKNSNCSWCINSTVTQLRAMTPVKAVHLHPDTGCIEVAHDSADPNRLVEAVRRNPHRWILA